jgi:hypothetical protein
MHERLTQNFDTILIRPYLSTLGNVLTYTDISHELLWKMRITLRSWDEQKNHRHPRTSRRHPSHHHTPVPSSGRTEWGCWYCRGEAVLPSFIRFVHPSSVLTRAPSPDSLLLEPGGVLGLGKCISYTIKKMGVSLNLRDEQSQSQGTSVLCQ